MKGQQPFPPVEGLSAPPTPTKCLWCGEPAKHLVEVEPPIRGNEKGVKVVKRAAVTQPACDACARRLEERKANALDEKARERRGSQA